MDYTASNLEEGRYVRRETVISAVINSAIGVVFFVLVFHGQANPGLWGAGGLVLDCLPQGFMVGLMSVVPPILLTRARLARGRVVASHGPPPRLPRRLLGLSLTAAVASMVCLTTLAAGLALMSGLGSLPFLVALPLKIIAGLLVTCIITPTALRATLRRAPIAI